MPLHARGSDPPKLHGAAQAAVWNPVIPGAGAPGPGSPPLLPPRQTTTPGRPHPPQRPATLRSPRLYFRNVECSAVVSASAAWQLLWRPERGSLIFGPQADIWGHVRARRCGSARGTRFGPDCCLVQIAMHGLGNSTFRERACAFVTACLGTD